MKVEDIKVGATYIGGNSGESRTVTGWGASGYVCWAPTWKRLPLGAFSHADTRCTTTSSFAKWAKEEVE